MIIDFFLFCAYIILLFYETFISRFIISIIRVSYVGYVAYDSKIRDVSFIYMNRTILLVAVWRKRGLCCLLLILRFTPYVFYQQFFSLELHKQTKNRINILRDQQIGKKGFVRDRRQPEALQKLFLRLGFSAFSCLFLLP